MHKFSYSDHILGSFLCCLQPQEGRETIIPQVILRGNIAFEVKEQTTKQFPKKIFFSEHILWLSADLVITTAMQLMLRIPLCLWQPRTVLQLSVYLSSGSNTKSRKQIHILHGTCLLQFCHGTCLTPRHQRATEFFASSNYFLNNFTPRSCVLRIYRQLDRVSQ